MSLSKRIYTLAAMICLSAGCTKDLVPVDYSEINPSIFPRTEADLQAMVNACYYPLRGSWGDGIYSTSERGVVFVSDATTEILHGKYGVQNVASLHNHFLTGYGFYL